MSENFSFGPRDVATYYRVRVPTLRQSHAIEWRSRCPIHQGCGDNFAVKSTDGAWFCHSKCGRGGSMLDLEMALTGLDFMAAKSGVLKIVGRGITTHNIVDRYSYTDERCRLLYEVVRFEPKTFRPRRPDGRGRWQWGYGNVRRVLYRLTEVIEAPIIFVAEGERDCEALRERGFAATTNAGGANAWREDYNPFFSDKDVIILPDADAPGWSHALHIARGIVAFAASVRLVELPNVKDAAEWFAAGHSELELLALVEQGAKSCR
jgi:DNA primase